MSKWQGTPVPNSGYVEKLYFNTNLPIDEVMELLASLPYVLTPFLGFPLYPILFSNSGSPVIFVVKVEMSDAMTRYEIQYATDIVNQVSEVIFAGIDSEGAGPLPLLDGKFWSMSECETNCDVISNYSGINVGANNEVISKLVSITPFVEVQEQLTLNSFLTSIADAIRSKKGTTDKINASNFASEIESISGGSGIIEVEELPTENIQEGVIYKVNKISDVDVLGWLGEPYIPVNLEQFIINFGATPTLIFEVVDSLPSTPNVSNLQTFSPAYVYIQNDIPYVYGNAGYGNMWLDIATIFNSLAGTNLENKGYVSNINDIVEAGLYVTYDNEPKYFMYKNEWIQFKNNNIELTINPTTEEQIIIPERSNDYYSKLIVNPVTSDIDSRIKPEYIKKGVKILGVTGELTTMENYLWAHGGGLIFIEEIKIQDVFSLSWYLFYGLNVGKIDLHISYTSSNKCYIYPKCFAHCSAHTIKLKGDKRLEIVKTNEQGYYNGNMVSLNVYSSTFRACSNLIKLVLDFPEFEALTSSQIPTDKYATDIFAATPIANGTGYIYVPDALVDTVKALEGWSLYASQIKPLSEYVE